MTQAITGTWRLSVTAFTASDGAVTQPWTEDAVGWLVLGADGNMSAQIMRPGRQLPVDEGYMAYFGQYHLHEAAGTLTTAVEGALNPSMLGTEQVRWYTLEGDTLTLRTPELANGTVGELVWERLPADG
jgi:Lipocalin-like domain